jgi:hypothetical protein
MRRNFGFLLLSMTVLLGAGFRLSAGGKGAVVVKDLDCTLLDGNMTSVPAPGGAQEVITPSGNVSFVCQGTVTPPADGTAIQWDATNMPTTTCCVAGDGTICTADTPDWRETISASGQATLTCVVNGSGS